MNVVYGVRVLLTLQGLHHRMESFCANVALVVPWIPFPFIHPGACLVQEASFDLQGLRTTDLNKLVIFMAIYNTQSVSGAATCLGLTQPAVSNTLASLRRCYGDDLFVRLSGGMRPTAKADLIAEHLAKALAAMSEVIGLRVSTDHSAITQFRS